MIEALKVKLKYAYKMRNEWKVTFMCRILDKVGRVTEFRFDFCCGREEAGAV